MCLWKLKSLSKITPRLRTLSDGDISLSSNLTGKWLESLCLCCFVPIIIDCFIRIGYFPVIVVICICVHCGPSIESRLYAISLFHTIMLTGFYTICL